MIGNSNQILISVIVPVYKVEKYIHQCVDSILAQTYQNIQLILVNDGSPDNCGVICDEYAQNDSRVFVIHQQNAGQSVARNNGILISKGEYIILIDSDDYWGNIKFLSNIIQVIENNNKPDIIMYNCMNYYEDYKVYKKDFRNFSSHLVRNIEYPNNLKTLIKENIFTASPWNKCIKSSVIKENKIYFMPGFNGEDIEWSGRILLNIKSVEILNDYSYIYRRRSGSITTTTSIKIVNDIISIVQNAINFSNTISNPELKNIFLSYYAYQYSTLLVSINSIIDLNAKKILNEKIHNLSEILKYNLDKRVKIIYFLKLTLGLNIASLLLTKVFRFKNKIN